MKKNSEKHVVYVVYHPDGFPYAEFTDRKQAKKFLEEKNSNIPSWHYDELWKYQSCLVEF